jgi:hypothetical protein
VALSYNFARTAYAAQDEQAREQEWPVVSMVILLTQVIGIGSFTKKNINEVVARIRFLETLRGAFMHTGGKDVPLPASIIRSLVGLTTNAPTETRGKFQKRIADNWFLDTLRELNEEEG